MKNWKHMPEKQAIREWIVSFLGSDGALGNYLHLAGWDPKNQQAGQCFRTGLRLGTVGPKTVPIIAERKSEWVEPIRQDYLELGYSPVMLKGDLHKTTLPVKEVAGAFLDYTGTITHEMVEWWVSELRNKLRGSSKVAFTFPYCPSHGSDSYLVKQARALLTTDLKSLDQEVEEYYQLHDSRIRTLFILIKSVFNEFECVYRGAQKYRDPEAKLVMVAFRFEHFNRLKDGRTNGFPSIEHFINPQPNEDTPMTTLTSGQKSAITRKLNAEKRVRSERARKANVTRGEAGRKEAGRKAVETKRKKAILGGVKNKTAHDALMSLSLKELTKALSQAAKSL